MASAERRQPQPFKPSDKFPYSVQSADVEGELEPSTGGGRGDYEYIMQSRRAILIMLSPCVSTGLCLFQPLRDTSVATARIAKSISQPLPHANTYRQHRERQTQRERERERGLASRYSSVSGTMCGTYPLVW